MAATTFEFPFRMECNFLQTSKDGDWECDDWQVNLIRQNEETMNLVFHQGIGHRIRVFFGSDISYRNRIGTTVYHTPLNGTSAFVNSRENPAFIPVGMSVRIPEGGAYVEVPQPPTIESVISCIVSDSDCYENARDFEEFASDLGYDPDSRKAYAIWEKCGEQYRQWKRFMHGLDLEPIEEFAREY